MASIRTAHLTIGEVLGLLVEEFPDVTISKIRFLESQGLIDPERSPSGYRKFSDRDVDRLRYVMREQREHYLPLKVIKDRLDAIDATNPGLPRPTPAGASWATAPGGSPEVVQAVGLASATGSRSTDADEAHRAWHSELARSDEDSSVGQSAGEPEEEFAAVVNPGEAELPSSPETAMPTSPLEGSALADDRQALDAFVEVDPQPNSARDSEIGRSDAAVQAGSLANVTEFGELPPAVDRPADRRYTEAELIAVTGAEERLVSELRSFGLLHTETRGVGEVFDQSSIEIIAIAQRFIERGVEVRHLRSWRLAADKEAALFEQLVVPFVRQRNPQAREQAARLITELSVLGGQLRGQLVRDALRQFLDP